MSNQKAIEVLGSLGFTPDICEFITERLGAEGLLPAASSGGRSRPEDHTPTDSHRSLLATRPAFEDHAQTLNLRLDRIIDGGLNPYTEEDANTAWRLFTAGWAAANVPHKGTGRTTRMLEEAIKQAAAGYDVMILAADNRHRDALVLQLHSLNAERVPITVRPISWIRTFDWVSMRIRPLDPNIITFVDHHAIESHLANALRELHRFDLPPAESAG